MYRHARILHINDDYDEGSGRRSLSNRGDCTIIIKTKNLKLVQIIGVRFLGYTEV